MKSFGTAALLSLSASALAAPRLNARWHHGGQCMSSSEAQQVADNYAELIRQYSVTLANNALAEDFVDYSESVNSLINTCPQGSAAVHLPLLSPTFSSRAQFEAGQGQQAPINFNILNLESNCNTVTIRWESTNTAPIPNPRPVIGIILIEAEKAPSGSTYPWIIKTVYSEFDAAAWLQNLEQAGICAQPTGSATPINLPSGTTVFATATGATTAVTTAPGTTLASYTSAVVPSGSSPVSYSASSASAGSSSASSYAQSSAAASSLSASVSTAPSYGSSGAPSGAYGASTTVANTYAATTTAA